MMNTIKQVNCAPVSAYLFLKPKLLFSREYVKSDKQPWRNLNTDQEKMRKVNNAKPL